VGLAVWLASSLFETPQNPLDGFREKEKGTKPQAVFIL
jgi:hypothetical protein